MVATDGDRGEKGGNVAGSDREINHISGRAYNVSCVLRATNLRLPGQFYLVYTEKRAKMLNKA